MVRMRTGIALSLLPLALGGAAATGGCGQTKAAPAERKAEAAYEERLVGLTKQYYQASLDAGKRLTKNRHDPGAHSRYCLEFAAQTRAVLREMDATPLPPDYGAVHRAWRGTFADSAETYEAMGREGNGDIRSRLHHQWQDRRDAQTKTAEAQMRAVAAKREAAGKKVHPWFRRWRG